MAGYLYQKAVNDPQFLSSILDNSYKNYHVKGFSYLCVHRSNTLTDKIYFFGDEISFKEDLVVPHNHRYDFSTRVIHGSVTNFTFTMQFIPSLDNRYKLHNYTTPLNGGKGFDFIHDVGLNIDTTKTYHPKQWYFSKHSTIHTIRVNKPNSVIRLTQYEDVLDLKTPTLAFSKNVISTNNDGLYEKFRVDEVLDLLLKAGL